jgi:para-nitrobenzyl esterase
MLAHRALRRSFAAILAAFATTITMHAAIAADAIEVTIPQGTLQGVGHDGLMEFMGVRYAQSTAGDKRWTAPVAVPNFAGFVDATKPGAACAQGPSPWGTPSTEEDCLFLNITVPGKLTDVGFWQNKPVLVFLHGGGFSGGSGDVYNAQAMARDNDVIVVTINYRLGALGMMAHPAIDAENHLIANYGMLDQQLALKWIKANIASFGGNPQNVTLFGESAGSIAIYAHLVSPLANDLFQKVIIESGAPSSYSLAEAEKNGAAFADKLDCPADASAEAAACLRAAPIDKILAAQAIPLAIIEDGKILPGPVEALTAAGDFHRMPIMNGNNRDEGNLFAAFIWDLSGTQLTADQMDGALAIAAAFIPRVGYTAPYIPLVKAAYDVSKYDVPALAAAQVMTDAVVACPALEMSKRFAKYAPVFQYEMADLNARSIVAPPISFPYRAAHFSELQYLFDLSSITLKDTPPMTPEQEALGKQMRAYWAAFARNGNPNAAGLPLWSPFSAAASGPVQSLVPPQSRAVADFKTRHQCDFWATVERK